MKFQNISFQSTVENIMKGEGFAPASNKKSTILLSPSDTANFKGLSSFKVDASRLRISLKDCLTEIGVKSVI